jgi:thiol-disulfide isomerase/thioredoxin
VDFWTYSCINCLRTLPYIKAWNEKYKASGLVIIGVHTPEFPFEKDESNVRKAVKDLGVVYPVAMDNFASPGGFNQDDPKVYKTPDGLKLNQWALSGNWKDEDQVATSLAPDTGISFRFHARDLHLVLGPPVDGKPVRFRVTIDGHAPGADHGLDTDAEGYGNVTGDRLYQLVRQRGSIQDRTFRIEFLAPGVRAYSFTFG